MIDFGLIFVLGLVGSLHCLQMCGPVVLAYSIPMKQGRFLGHAGYHAGRILTYMALGAAAGALGTAVGMAGRMAGMASAARIFAGAAMVLAGVALLGLLRSDGLVRIERRGVTAYCKRAIGKLMLSARPGGKFQLGLLLGFLPCGLVYAALLKAVDAGTALSGALTMLAFGLGTAPALAGMGLASQFAGRYLGRWSHRLAAVSLMLMGAFLLWRGIAAPAVPHCHAHG
jgi:uncharacterized protein